MFGFSESELHILDRLIPLRLLHRGIRGFLKFQIQIQLKLESGVNLKLNFVSTANGYM